MSQEQNKAPKNQWTEDQLKAIEMEGSDILVAAAAGSGKTAVLVERIIQKVLREDNPINVDELLVVTFTKASAQEMKERIGNALENQLQVNPTSDHLRKQIALLNKASISTIHSFCTDVIRSNYYLLNIDPNFRTAEEIEIKLLMDEVLEEMLEEEYSDETNEVFFEFVSRYTSDRDDEELTQFILKLYRHAVANPDPNAFLDQLLKNYDVEDKTIDELPFVQLLKKYLEEDIQAFRSSYEQALQLANSPDGPIKYVDLLQEEYFSLEKLARLSEMNWDDIRNEFQNIQFKRIAAIKKGECNEQKKELAKGYRDDVKKGISDLLTKYFSRPSSGYLEQLRELQPLLIKLVDLVKNFRSRFQEAKMEKGILDFNDLEHFALQILMDENGEGKLLPSAVAKVYQEKFHEVLVDEYQDTNYVQESILKLITSGEGAEGNLFMVGDVKQSIYRFRLAEPQLFISKYNTYYKNKNEETGLKIDLSKNFRSRAEVLDATNYIFNQIMGESLGGIDYDEDAMLKLGASYPSYDACMSELVLLTKADLDEEVQEESEYPEEMNTSLIEEKLEQIEARYVAKRVKELVSTGYLVTEKNGSMRPVQYKDIAILARSLSNADMYIEEFKAQGIPLYAEKSNNLFETIEIAIFLNLLKVIDNPIQDIPLASVLRSPIVGLSEKELAEIRIQSRKGSFYDAVIKIVNNELEFSNLRVKSILSSFIDQLSEWRSIVQSESLSLFIWRVLKSSAYFDFVGGLPGGKQRQANLMTVFEKAKVLEKTNYRSLFQFLRFLDRMQERGEELGEVRLIGEQENIVQMMTIHKSKGLEFPVVFVINTSKQFNTRDLSSKLILHKELGLGINYVHPVYRTSTSTLLKETIKRTERDELLSEELRILYVALTRAREKLILVGRVKDIEKSVSSWREVENTEEWLLPRSVISGAKSYLDWIGASIIRHDSSNVLRDEKENWNTLEEIKSHPTRWHFEVIDSSTLTKDETDEYLNEKEEVLTSIQKKETIVVSKSEIEDSVKERLQWQYPYLQATLERPKQSVTELKRKMQEEELFAPKFMKQKRMTLSRPKFMESMKLNAAEVGTATHAVMQYLNYDDVNTIDSIKGQMEEMVQKELLTSDQVKAIDVKNIYAFCHTLLGQKVKNAKRIQREVPFSYGISASELYPNWIEEDELILIQGIIDLLLVEDDGVVLIDYKTDKTTAYQEEGALEKEAKKRYGVQIDLYSKAIEASLEKEVKERYLYFFDGGHTIKL